MAGPPPTLPSSASLRIAVKTNFAAMNGEYSFFMYCYFAHNIKQYISLHSGFAGAVLKLLLSCSPHELLMLRNEQENVWKMAQTRPIVVLLQMLRYSTELFYLFFFDLISSFFSRSDCFFASITG